MSRVYVAKCPNYDARTVETAFHQSLVALDGQTLIQRGDRVVLKANLLQAQPPERAITTHPTVVAAIARWVRDAGATPIIADSPGGLLSQRILRHVYEVTGMTAVAEETGAVLNFDIDVVRVECPEGRVTRQLDAMKVFVEADAIISLPKLKTHDLALLTGAVKNLFGTVPGIVKGAYHARFPSVDRFSGMLVDIVVHYKPLLTVMDAVVGMEGDGPSGGDPRHVGLLLTSTDAVAVDVVSASIVGMGPLSVHTIRAAVRRGLTSGRVEDIEVLGSSLEEVRVAGFRRPRTGSQHMRMIPDIVPGWVVEQLLAKPCAGPKCTACGICVQNCPVQAITIVDGLARTDHSRCIRCYCCNELCPINAVELHQPWLARLVDFVSTRLLGKALATRGR